MLDVDECDENTGNCATEANCINTVGSFICQCITGYSGDGVSCNGKAEGSLNFSYYDHNNNKCTLFIDDNECAEGRNSCHENADCTNAIGSYDCSCIKGYSGNGRICDGKIFHP